MENFSIHSKIKHIDFELLLKLFFYIFLLREHYDHFKD